MISLFFDDHNEKYRSSKNLYNKLKKRIAQNCYGNWNKFKLLSKETAGETSAETSESGEKIGQWDINKNLIAYNNSTEVGWCLSISTSL